MRMAVERIRVGCGGGRKVVEEARGVFFGGAALQKVEIRKGETNAVGR